ncbi:MAG: ferredoxin oxidoreductase [Bdellovibrionaceae bacterium]|nr:ferredoxin oxidoreductase [Pseudobdellovibrionaceae bacterium]|tara:strand:- start:1084 stop:2880 length:1797 start_codon:yes stop_codon:yes gene_type:complete
MKTDFSIQVATINGSGSQSSNQVLARSLFRMGIPVGAKNLFPSNIAGLPTWFTIRVSVDGFTARKETSDIYVSMNPDTLAQDLENVSADGLFFYNSDLKWDEELLKNSPVQKVAIPFKELIKDVSDSVRLKKLLVNMAYVGVLAELLKIPEATLEESLKDQFKGKEAVIGPNRDSVQAGLKYAKEHLKDLNFPFSVKATSLGSQGKILIDGNTSAGLGLVFGGCTVACWYPITPSSSLIENFIHYAEKYRKDENGKDTFCVVQAEDELAAFSMVVGAGWAGARAVTATSGPGLSLMAEAAGLAYYAEVPSVIWNVQRTGPSTGLPTRTMQGDILSAFQLSHGDTKHVVLLPSTPKDCFEFAQVALDLAERLQTLVIVLSDLDLGMNLRVSDSFTYPTKPFDRGKVLTAAELEARPDFGRYKDVDGDGIPYRANPGTAHERAGYFTRGSGHDSQGAYSESNKIYKANMIRLQKKFDTARTLVPKPDVHLDPQAKIGLIYFGSTSECISEAQHLLKQKSYKTSTLQLKALPFTSDVEEFLKQHDHVYVIEQNRDAQLMAILKMEKPNFCFKLQSVLQFDGLPLTANEVSQQILEREAQWT